MGEVLTIWQSRHQTVNITVYDGSQPYSLTTGEKLLFGVKKRKNSPSYTIYKELTEDNISESGAFYVLELTTAETNVSDGYYYFDVSLKRTNNEIEPVISTQECYIDASITGVT